MNSRALKTAILIIAGLATALTASCGKSPVSDDPGSVSISLNTAAAAPGQRVLISGYTVAPAQFSGYTVKVGPSEAAVLNDGSGGLWFYVPMVFDSTTLWHNPPTGPVNVELLQHGTQKASAAGNFTYLALPRAPGTTRRSLEDLIAIVDALRTIATTFAPDSTVARGVFMAGLAATDSLINEPEGVALLSALDGLEQDSVVIGIIDAMLSTTQIDVYLADYLQLFNSPVSPLRRYPRQGTAASLSYFVDDYDLATLMQIGGVLGNFGTNFLDGFSSDLGNIGTAGGLLKDLADKVPYLQNSQGSIIEGGSQVFASVRRILDRIETVVSIIEFVINRLIASIVPTDIDSIRIEVAPDSLDPGDITDSLNGTVYASNSPDTVTFDDVISWTLTLMGELAGDPQTKRDSVAANINKWLGRFKGVMNTYADDWGITWDQDAFTLFNTPNMTWEADVVTPDIYSLVSSDPASMDQHLQTLNWEASDSAVGTVDLWITPSDDPSKLNITVPAAVSYSGGTFGPSYTPSNKEEVFIGDALHIEADLPAYLVSGQTDSVTFRVGVTNNAGGYVWLGNTDLVMSALFGSIAATTGTTDANGEFTTTATKNMIGSNGVEITVHATDSTGRTGEETFTIPYVGDLLLELGFPNESGFPHSIGDPATLAVRAGHITTGGEITYLPNIDIFLAVNNGTASPNSGTTNADGFMFSSIAFGSGQDSLMIYASGTGIDGISALDSVYALRDTAGQEAYVKVLEAQHSLSDSYLAINVTGQNCGNQPPTDTCEIQDDNQATRQYALTVQGFSDAYSETCGSVSVSGSGSTTADVVDPDGDSLVSEFNIAAESQASIQVAVEGGGQASFTAASMYWFEVPESGVNYEISGTVASSETGQVRLDKFNAHDPERFLSNIFYYYRDPGGPFTRTGTLSQGFYRLFVGAGSSAYEVGCGGSDNAQCDASLLMNFYPR